MYFFLIVQCKIPPPPLFTESLGERRKECTTLIARKERGEYFSFLRSPKIVLKYIISRWQIPDSGEQVKLKASFKCIINLLWGRLYCEWVSKEKLEIEPKMQKTFPQTSFLLELCCVYRLWARGLVRLWTTRECFWVLICGLCLGQRVCLFLFSWKAAFQFRCQYSCLLGCSVFTLPSPNLLSNSIYFCKKDVLRRVEGKAYCPKKCCFLVRATCSCLSSRLEKFGEK